MNYKWKFGNTGWTNKLLYCVSKNSLMGRKRKGEGRKEQLYTVSIQWWVYRCNLDTVKIDWKLSDKWGPKIDIDAKYRRFFSKSVLRKNFSQMILFLLSLLFLVWQKQLDVVNVFCTNSQTTIIEFTVSPLNLCQHFVSTLTCVIGLNFFGHTTLNYPWQY